MNIDNIDRVSLIDLATSPKLDKRKFEQIFSSLGYQESGKLMLQLVEIGWLTRTPGLLHTSEALKTYAQPWVNTSEKMVDELVAWLEPFVKHHFPDAELKKNRSAAFWWGNASNFYRFNLIDANKELVWQTRYSSELTSSDNFSLTSHRGFYRFPLAPQTQFLEAHLLAHLAWAETMQSIGRGLKG